MEKGCPQSRTSASWQRQKTLASSVEPPNLGPATRNDADEGIPELNWSFLNLLLAIEVTRTGKKPGTGRGVGLTPFLCGLRPSLCELWRDCRNAAMPLALAVGGYVRRRIMIAITVMIMSQSAQNNQITRENCRRGICQSGAHSSGP